MRKIIVVYLFLFPIIINAQTAYHEALRLADKYSIYQKVIKETERYRDSLMANADIISTNFQLGNKKEAAYYQYVQQFLLDPFKPFQSPYAVEKSMQQGGQNPYEAVVLEVWDYWVDSGIMPAWEIVFPFLDQSRLTIMSIEHTPLYTYNPEEGLFYFSDTDILVLSTSLHSGIPFDPAYKNYTLKAVYNPIDGGLYLWNGVSFDHSPHAFFNPLDGEFYRSLKHQDQHISDFRLLYPEFFHTKEDILLLYQNQDQQEIEVFKLGPNIPNAIDFKDSRALSIEEESGAGITRSVFTPNAGIQQSLLESNSVSSFPSMAIDALAQFLVDRTKEELILAFFERFSEKMQQSSELRTLFPNTYFLLQSQDLFRLPSMGPLWVETFQSDVFQLLPNTEKLLLTDSKYAELLDQPKVKAFRLTNQLLQLYQEEFTPLSLLEQIHYQFGNDPDPISKNVEILYRLGSELSIAYEAGMLSPTELLKMDVLTEKYFTALLYYKHREILVNTMEDEPYYRASLQANHRPLTQSMVNLSKLFKDISLKSESYRLSLLEGDSLSNQNHFFHLSQTVHQLLEFGFKLQFLTQPDAYFQSEEYQSFYPVIRNTIQATEDIQREELGIFLIHYLQLLEPLLDQNFNSAEEETARQILKDMFFYASFMVDILSARNSQQIHGILQQYALPIGSYRLKRRSSFSLEVNAYPGLYAGWEEGLNSPLDADNVLGITAPVGFSLSWGESQNKNGQSFGIFIPFIDVGAAFSYRWSGKANGFPEQLRWRQVLSPGLHGVWGFRKLPISLMAGMQFTPQLRKINPQDLSSSNANVWRYGISAVVDIPLFNIYLRE